MIASSAFVNTLYDLCIRKVASSHPLYSTELNNLPNEVKNKLLNIYTKRGIATDDILRWLLNPDTQKLELSACDLPEHSFERINVCKRLRKLHLDCDGTANIVTDKVLCHVLPNMPHLTEVHLRRCQLITDISVECLARSCSQSLIVVDLGGCHHVSNVGLSALARYCPRIRALTLIKTNITDNGIFSLTESDCAQTLSELQIDKCPEITDEAIEAIVMFCPRISILTFSGCPKLTEQTREIIGEMHRTRQQTLKHITWTIY